MRWVRLLSGLGALLLLWAAAPAYGVGNLVMKCPVCDHVDVDGHGLAPNATVILVIRDLRSGQEVLPETPVRTDGSGSFSREIEMDLAKHPSLAGTVYRKNGTDFVLAAHSRAQAPAHCSRAASLPYTGSRSELSAVLAGGLLAAGGVLLLVTRRRAGPAGP
jgi:LPXTG-motif cell wall-anchored protein